MSSDKLLGDVVRHKKGFAFKSKDYVEEGIPVVRVSNFTDDSISKADLKFVGKDVAEANKDVALQPFDIVVATVGSWPNNPASVVGRTISVPIWVGSALMNQNSVILRAKSNLLTDQRFIYYQMKGIDFSNHVISKAQGSANQASITLDTIFSYPIFWPPQDQREEVVSFLAALDDRITLLRETNATLEAIAQALFKSWFVDFDPVRAKMEGRAQEGMDEATIALFPDSFEESELGLVPKGWGVSTVGRSFTLTMGQSPPGDTYNEIGEGLPFYQGRTDFGFRFPSQRVFCTAPTRLAEIGDTLVSVRAPVGDVNVALESCALGRGVASVRSLNGYSGFTFYSIRSLKSYFELHDGEGTVFGSINKKDFESLPVIAPDNSVVNAFESIVSVLDDSIRNNEQKLRTLSVLRDTLLPRLISGQMRLPELTVD